jgi:hypothetical protein
LSTDDDWSFGWESELHCGGKSAAHI